MFKFIDSTHSPPQSFSRERKKGKLIVPRVHTYNFDNTVICPVSDWQYYFALPLIIYKNVDSPKSNKILSINNQIL